MWGLLKIRTKSLPEFEFFKKECILKVCKINLN